MEIEWVTIPDVAARLGKSEQTVRRMISRHELPAKRESSAPNAKWLIDGWGELDGNSPGTREMERRRWLIGVVTGRGGDPASDAAPSAIREVRGDDTADAVGEAMSRTDLIEMFARDIEEHRDELARIR